MRASFLRLTFRIHKWTALTFGLLLILQAASGIVIAIAHEGENRRLAQRARPPASLAAVADYFAAKGAWVDRLTVRPDGSLEARIRRTGRRQPSFAIVHPTRGEIGALQSLWDDPVQVARYWHNNLLLQNQVGTWLRRAVGAAGLIILFAGVVLWWPRGRSLGSGFVLHWQWKRDALLFDLHRVLGAAAAVPVLLVVGAGMLTALQPIVLPAVPTDACAARSTSTTVPFRELDSLINAGISAYPDMRLELVRFCVPGHPVVGVFLVPRDRDLAGVRVQLWFDLGSDEPPRIVSSERPQDGIRAGTLLIPIHSGRLFGIPGRLVNMTAGLMVIALGVTGLTLWWWRRRRRIARLRTSRSYYS